MESFRYKEVKYLNKIEKKEVNELLNSSFPKDQRTPLWYLILRSKNKYIKFYAFYDDDKLVGLTYFILSENTTFLLYFAINPNIRSKGYGSRLLNFVKEYKNDNKVFLTIEEVDKKYDNYCQRLQRYNFYIKNNFTLESFLVHEYGDGDYMFMSYNGKCTFTDLEKAIKVLTTPLFYNFYKAELKE